MLPWKPEFWSNLAQNLMQSIPHPNDASDENLILIGQLVSEIFMFESVNTRTDGRRLQSHTISFGSGELKNKTNIVKVWPPLTTFSGSVHAPLPSSHHNKNKIKNKDIKIPP